MDEFNETRLIVARINEVKKPKSFAGRLGWIEPVDSFGRLLLEDVGISEAIEPSLAD